MKKDDGSISKAIIIASITILFVITFLIGAKYAMYVMKKETLDAASRLQK